MHVFWIGIGSHQNLALKVEAFHTGVASTGKWWTANLLDLASGIAPVCV